MTTDYKVTELFCIIDEFCKHFNAENAGNKSPCPLCLCGERNPQDLSGEPKRHLIKKQKTASSY